MIGRTVSAGPYAVTLLIVGGELTLAIRDRYETPPYGGKWSNIVPHLSVACVKDEQYLDHVASDFAQAARGRLPIRSTAAEVALIEKRSERCRARGSFGLRRE